MMTVSRRAFFNLVGAGGRAPLSPAVLAARGLEAYYADAQGGRGGQGGRAARPPLPPGVEEIRINSNENPLGPGKVALDAILGKFPEASRYPFNSSPSETDLADTIAKKYAVTSENVVMGAGSQEILKSAIRAFVSPYRHLVTAAPTFENCTSIARRLKYPVTEIKVDSSFRLDLESMVATVRGAGLAYICNPNNPTATVHGAKTITDFVERVRRVSPDTVILIDEAYHDYVTDPSYETAVPLALNTPNVFVARTFSKAYGMAGMRIGYAVGQADTVRPLARLKMPYNVSVFGIAAAIASLGDQRHIDEERARNTEVKTFTVKALEDLGCKATDSQANFLFVSIGRSAKEFREACAKTGVMVGRDFPPFEGTHSRISLGTMDEMRKATEVFRDVLRPSAPAGGGR